jgi:hypothetical protein
MTIHPKTMTLLVAADAMTLQRERAELLLQRFNKHYRDLTLLYVQAGKAATRSAEAVKMFQDLHNDMCRRMAEPDYQPAKRDKLRHSSKTGKSWPKPKGSY